LPSSSASSKKLVEVVPRLREVLVDTRFEVLIELALVFELLAPPSAVMSTSSMMILIHPPGKKSESSPREAEHPHDHPDRDVLRVLDGGVERVFAFERIEQLVAQLAGVNGLQLGDPLGRRNAGQEQTGAPSGGTAGSDVIGGRDGRSEPGRVVVIRDRTSLHDDAARGEVFPCRRQTAATTFPLRHGVAHAPARSGRCAPRGHFFAAALPRWDTDRRTHWRIRVIENRWRNP